MAFMNCVDCHEPHTKAEFGAAKVACTSCHAAEGVKFEGSSMQKMGVDCVDCHMPRATKSAAALGPFEGDVRTHVWKINIDPNASMFSEDGGQANSYLTVEFTCLQCHQDKDKDWAAGNAENIHAQGK